MRWMLFAVIIAGLGIGCRRDAITEAEAVDHESSSVAPDYDQAYPVHTISILDTPALYRIPDDDEDSDPLADVADVIRSKIDPTLRPQWPDGHKSDYVEHIKGIHPDYAEFWRRIPSGARRYVDLFNDGHPEYVVISDELNSHYWGFLNFMAVLHRPPDNRGTPSETWEILDLQVFGSGPSATTKGVGRSLSMRDLEIAVTDLDRNGRPNVLITTLQAGASGQTYTLHVIGIADDMSFVRHTLSSGTPIEVMDSESLRPVFARRYYDRSRPGEPSVAVRHRGYRTVYYQWTTGDGFVRF